MGTIPRNPSQDPWHSFPGYSLTHFSLLQRYAFSMSIMIERFYQHRQFSRPKLKKLRLPVLCSFQPHYLMILLYTIPPVAIKPLLTLHHHTIAPFKLSSPVFNVLHCHLKLLSLVQRKSFISSRLRLHALVSLSTHHLLSAIVPLPINGLPNHHQAKQSGVSTQKQCWLNSVTSSPTFFCPQMISQASLLPRRSPR